jgi:hypothetical protein
MYKNVITILGGRYYLKTIEQSGEEVKIKFTDNKESGILVFRDYDAAQQIVHMHELNGATVVEEFIN